MNRLNVHDQQLEGEEGVSCVWGIKKRDDRQIAGAGLEEPRSSHPVRAVSGPAVTDGTDPE
jgi:hypothetical protein